MGLTFPNAAPRSLTEDELKKAKDLLSVRAATAAKLPVDKAAAQLAVTAGEAVPAYEISIQAVLEVRNPRLEPVTRPFTEGMNLPAVPAPVKEPFDVWVFPSEPPHKEMPAFKTVMLVPSTLEKKDCPVCLAKGSAPCKLCFSKGTVNCDTCMGAGSQPCSVCKGLAKISCPDCEGTGKIKSGGMTNKLLGPCGSCGGAGKFSCNHCAGGKVDCATCGNSGKKACGGCEGKGRMVCASCGGVMKIVVGQGFQAEFRPQQATLSGAAAAAPEAVVSQLLSRKGAPAVQEFPTGDALLKELAVSDLPESFKGLVEQTVNRLKPPSLMGRLSRVKLSVSSAAAWRLTGAYAGHEFVYWVEPASGTIVPERDPLKDMSQKSVNTAQEALKRGDWEVAVDAARETLSLDPHHSEARAIAGRWRAKLFRETLLLGVGAGLVGAAAMAVPIFFAQKGLHRTGPAVFSGVMALSVGLLVALVLLPLARHLFPTKKRMTTVGGASLGAVAIFLFLVKGVFGWNPVKSADQKALAWEMGKKFKYGVSAVFHQPDLDALQDIYTRYQNSQADLTEVNNHIQAQTLLKNELEVLTREFISKLDEARYSSLFLPDKRAQIVDIKDHYALRNVDVAPAEKALQEIDQQIAKSALPSRTRSRGKLSITPLRPAGSSASKPAAKKAAVKAPAKSSSKSKSSAKPVAKKAVKPASKKKKGITPNKEVVDPKKKKKGFFSGAPVD